MSKSLSQLQAKLKMLNTLCNVEDDMLGNSSDPEIKAAQDLFNYIWSELQDVETELEKLVD